MKVIGYTARQKASQGCKCPDSRTHCKRAKGYAGGKHASIRLTNKPIVTESGLAITGTKASILATIDVSSARKAKDAEFWLGKLGLGWDDAPAQEFTATEGCTRKDASGRVSFATRETGTKAITLHVWGFESLEDFIDVGTRQGWLIRWEQTDNTRVGTWGQGAGPEKNLSPAAKREMGQYIDESDKRHFNLLAGLRPARKETA
jgi:hypothetical protein